MSALMRALHRFWFTPASSHTLALARFVLCAYVLYYMLRVDLGRLRAVSRRPLEFMEHSLVLDLLPLPFPLPGQLLTIFGVAMLGLGLMAAVGLFTRPALLLFALGYCYMGAAIGAWGYLPHSRIVPVQALFILAFAPGATAWSVDRLLRWAWQRRKGAADSLRAALAGPLVPRWGTQLIVAVLATVMLSAGISKLRHSGWQWADGQTLGFYLKGGVAKDIVGADVLDAEQPNVWRDGFASFVGRGELPPEVAWKDGVGLDGHLYLASGTRLGRLVARHQWALVALALGTLLFELAAPLMLINHKLRSLYLLGAAGFFMGIRLTMGINFMSWVALGLCLVDWRWLTSPLRARLRKPRLALARPLPARPAAPGQAVHGR